MMAYYVYNDQDNDARIIIPDMHCTIPVSEEALQQFISATPDFGALSTESCGELAPVDFGVVVATRDTAGDVNVLKERLWELQLTHYLGGPE